MTKTSGFFSSQATSLPVYSMGLFIASVGSGIYGYYVGHLNNCAECFRLGEALGYQKGFRKGVKSKTHIQIEGPTEGYI